MVLGRTWEKPSVGTPVFTWIDWVNATKKAGQSPVQPLDKSRKFSGGAKEDRTPDLVIANDALSQLSYGPRCAATRRGCRDVMKCSAAHPVLPRAWSGARLRDVSLRANSDCGTARAGRRWQAPPHLEYVGTNSERKPGFVKMRSKDIPFISMACAKRKV